MHDRSPTMMMRCSETASVRSMSSEANVTELTPGLDSVAGAGGSCCNCSGAGISTRSPGGTNRESEGLLDRKNVCVHETTVNRMTKNGNICVMPVVVVVVVVVVEWLPADGRVVNVLRDVGAIKNETVCLRVGGLRLR